MEKLNQTAWSLIGSESQTGTAQNNGLLILTNIRPENYVYEIFNGNNIKYKWGALQTSNNDEKAILSYIIRQENIPAEYTKELDISSALDIIRFSGHYTAEYNYASKSDNDLYLVREISTNQIIKYLSSSKEAYDYMVLMNKKVHSN